MANLYTKTGDKGQTSLVGGSRVSKSSLRVECYGTIDEANSMLGLAYAQTDREYIRTTVHRIQGRLFALGAELASDEQGAAGLTGKISEEDVAFLEGVVDKCTETTGKQTHFVIPGVDPASAALHVARTIVRRAFFPLISSQRLFTDSSGGARAGTRGVGPLHQPPVRRGIRAGQASRGSDAGGAPEGAGDCAGPETAVRPGGRPAPL